MPATDPDANIFNFPMPKRGINLNKNIVELHPEEAIQTQNIIYKNGLIKRGGQKKLSAAEVNAGNSIVGLHRFYKADGTTKQLIAVSDTDVRYENSGSWNTISTGQTADKQTHIATWGALNEIYVANETDDPFKWDGSTKTQFSAFGAANIPSTSALMFLPYQDRLLVIEGGDIRWSGAFVDGETSGDNWETIASCGVRPDTKLYGMIHHSINNISAGEHGRILVAGANGMYLFSGKDLRPPSTTGDYRLDSLATKVGCNAPRTMQWTPAGSMWLGLDRQVYLLPFDSVTPVPISQKLFSNNDTFEGIESIPVGQIANACAIYHNGYYILSVAGKGKSVNDRQWWLDVSRLQRDEDKHWGPWYGPMKGQNISVMVVQSGPGDGGELIAGESDASIGSFVYFISDQFVFGDLAIVAGTGGNAIELDYLSFYHPLGDPNFRKIIHRLEIESLNVLGTTIVKFRDIAGDLGSDQDFIITQNILYWGDFYWGDEYWSNSAPTRQVVRMSPTINTRRMAINISHSSNNGRFEIFALNVEAKEKNLIFD